MICIIILILVRICVYFTNKVWDNIIPIIDIGLDQAASIT